jgi:hypothetical protein
MDRSKWIDPEEREMKTSRTHGLSSIVATAAVVAWVDPSQLTRVPEDDSDFRRILKAAAAVAIFCLLVAYGPALMMTGDGPRPSLDASASAAVSVAGIEP